MNRSKTVALSMIAALSLTAVTLTYAADPSVKPEAANAEVSATTTTAKVTITQEQAVNIALKAYSGSKLLNAKLYDTVYIVRIATEKEKRYLKIGALSGRILQDSVINAQGKIEASSPVTTAAPKVEVKPVETKTATPKNEEPATKPVATQSAAPAQTVAPATTEAPAASPAAAK